MKVCPVCKSAVPDDAEYCDTCGNDEFFDGYSQQFEQPYQNGYEQPYQNGYEQQPQYDYNQPQYQQPQQQYGYQQNQYQPQPQYDYNQPQYQQPQQYGYQQNQYQQPPQPQYDYNQQQPQYDYNQQQYQQQPPQPQYDYNQQQYQQPQYEQEQYAQPQYQEQYEQPQYQEQYEQPVEEQQPVIEEPVVEEVQPSEEEQTVTEEPVAEEPSVEEQPVEEEVPEEPKENPHEMSKNFVFEKKEQQQQPQPQNTEKPKGIKGYLSMFLNTRDHTIEFDKDDIAKNSKNAILASFGITFWLPFIQKDYSRYARYYGNQGLLTLILMIPCTILYSLITGVVICNACTAAVYQNGVATFKYLTFGGWIAAIIFFAICYAIPIFIIYLSVTNIKQGKAKDIPLIGALRLIS